MSDNKYDGWDGLEKAKTRNESDQKHQKFEEWDNLFDNDESEGGLQESKLSVSKPAYAYSNGTATTQNSQAWGWIGVIGFALFFLFVVLPWFSGGGASGTYRLKNASFEKNSITQYEYSAIIENTSNQTHSYRVTLEIYTPNGSLYNSISEHYTLQADGTDTVWFFVNVPAGYYGSYKVKVIVT